MANAAIYEGAVWGESRRLVRVVYDHGMGTRTLNQVKQTMSLMGMTPDEIDGFMNTTEDQPDSIRKIDVDFFEMAEDVFKRIHADILDIDPFCVTMSVWK